EGKNNNRMDKIKKYQEAIKEVLKKHHSPKVKHNYDEYESQMVVDDERGHFFLLNVGWNQYDRIFSCMLHIDLKEDKIWIHQDWTEGVVDEFLAMDIPKEDLVLAFLAPYKRPYANIAA
ncbi:MAG: XisI protein, partial [Bacteroidota bacterium]